MASERFLGHVGVDAGTVVIGDPCYLVEGGGAEPPEWQEVVRQLIDEANPRRIAGTSAVEVAGTIMTQTPEGDDLYPVYGLIDDETGQFLSLRIDLRPESHGG